MDHFINSLRDELMIVRELPLKLQLRTKKRLYSMPPVSWSNETYYLKRVIFDLSYNHTAECGLQLAPLREW